MARVANKHFSFTDFRSALLDPSKEMSQGRKKLAEKAGVFKATTGLFEIVAGSVAIVSLFSSVRSPWFAPLAVLSALTALAMHEIRVIARNVEDLADGGIIARVNAALSPSHFTKAILKETLVTEDLFASSITKSLQKRA